MADHVKVLAQNRKAFHDFLIEDRFEAGISLLGPEVKSCREGKIQLKDSHVRIEDSQAFLYNCHISPYSHSPLSSFEPERRRRLLLHKREIQKLHGQTTLRGFTIIPLKAYLRNGRVKIEIALAKGKKQKDKREHEKTRSAEMEVRRHIGRRE